jgi:D-aspartate ligase
MKLHLRGRNAGAPAVLGTEPARVGPVAAVLLTDLNLLRCFAGLGVPTVVVSSDASDVTFSSRYCRHKEVIAPVSDPERALHDLLAVGRKFPHRPVLFYGDDATLLLVSRNREHLARYYRFLLPEPDLVEDLVDKTRFARLASRLALPVPRTVLSRALKAPEDVGAHLSLPCVLKPNYHIGWFESDAIRTQGGHPQKVLRATNADELHSMFHQMRRFTDDFVVQEYVSGDANSVYSFHAYVDRRSQPVAYYVGRKIRTYPRESGVSTYLELVNEPEVIRAGLEVLRTLGCVGVVKIDFKKDPDRGRFYLLEVNPRFNLWHYLGTVCGVNLPWLAYADLVGVASKPRSGYTTGVRWLSFGDDLRSFLRDYRPTGRLSWSAWLLSLRGKKVYDVFSWRDPYPSLVAVLNYTRATLTKLRRRLVA